MDSSRFLRSSNFCVALAGSPATTPKPAKRAHRSGDRVVSSPRIEDQNSLNTSPAPRTPPRFPHPQASFVMPPYRGQTHGDGEGRSTIVGSPATTPKPAKRAHRSGDRVVSSPRIEDQNSLNTSPVPRTPPRFPHPQASFVLPPYRGQTHGESNTSIYSVLPDPQVSTSRAPHLFSQPLLISPRPQVSLVMQPKR